MSETLTPPIADLLTNLTNCSNYSYTESPLYSEFLTRVLTDYNESDFIAVDEDNLYYFYIEDGIWQAELAGTKKDLVVCFDYNTLQDNSLIDYVPDELVSKVIEHLRAELPGFQIIYGDGGSYDRKCLLHDFDYLQNGIADIFWECVHRAIDDIGYDRYAYPEN